MPYDMSRIEKKATEALKLIEEDEESYKDVTCKRGGCKRHRKEFSDFCVKHQEIDRYLKNKACDFPLCNEKLSRGSFCRKHSQNGKKVRLGLYREKDLARHGLTRSIYQTSHWEEFIEVMVLMDKWTTDELVDLERKKDAKN